MARPGGWMTVCVEAEHSPSLEPASPLGGLVLPGKGPPGGSEDGEGLCSPLRYAGVGGSPPESGTRKGVRYPSRPGLPPPPPEALRGPGPRSS